jgi:vacuolar-type H+-ATPase subunit I/STV1
MTSPSDNSAWLAPAMNYWYSAFRPLFALYAAPQSLNEPILPWTFAGVVVNESNSGDPATEQAVVSQDSYGRQLGRISDALAFLIDKLPDEEKKDKTIRAFSEMKVQIDKIKRERETTRFDKVLSDLGDLRQHDETTFNERLARIDALAKK